MTTVEPVEFDTAQPDESDAILAIMCEAFDMELNAARPIYYSDPYFDLQNKYVLRLGGQAVSCLTVVDRDCWIGESVVRVAGIAGVATRPQYRRRGFAKRLLSETLRTLARRGFAVAALFSAHPAYYRDMGWETAGSLHISRCARSKIGCAAEIGSVRSAESSDIPRLRQIYDHATRGRAMHCLRDEKRWHYLLNYVPESSVAIGVDGDVSGYVLTDRRPAMSEPGAVMDTAPVTVRLLEMIGETPQAVTALRDSLAAGPGGEMVEYSAPRDVLAGNGFGTHMEAQSPFMARVIDWHVLLSSLAANWQRFEGELGVALVDPMLASAPCAAIVSATGGQCSIERVSAVDMSERCRDYAVGEVRAWSPVVVGHLSASDACALGLLKSSTQRAWELIGRMFPARAPFIPTADHF